MGCPSCGAAVPLDKRFCVECGAALSPRCPACGGTIPPGARFCGDCGTGLGAGTQAGTTVAGTAAAVPPAPVTATEAERRQLTVLFCDLVGSTALSARLDPEDLREVIGAYHRCVAEVVGRFEGHVAKYLGDGVLVYFGWPRAHEDAAERAVRAGLAVVEAVAALRAAGTDSLAARVGIATGLVVVGDLIGEGAAREEAVVGETPNLAARLQALAEPGRVVIGERTRRLVGELFECARMGSHRLKGFDEPIEAWQVVGPGRAESRFEARQAGGPTPLVGREEEAALLLRRWEQAKDGEGQVVLLSGEPGIGKSRLVRALRERLADEPHTPLRYQCSPHRMNSALFPVIDQLERAAGFERDDGPEQKLAKLEALLAGSTEDVGSAAPLLAALLSIPTGDRYPPLDLTPQRQKERTLDALVGQLSGLAAKRPVLMIFEDAHWIDPTSTDLLGLAVERVRGLPVLLVITFRPEFSPPWTGHGHTTTLALNRLSRRQVTAMVERIAGDKPLAATVLGEIVAKTDGVPLFVEELTKAVLESGLLKEEDGRYALAGPLRPLAIPATLHDSLMARLDRLAAAKQVAQIGAAIGREFPYELLAAVAPLPEGELRDALGQLCESELVFRRGVLPEASYVFKHALVQDAAYQSLLRGRRQELHARIAGALKEKFPGAVAAAPEVLADHYSRAGLAEEAVDYWSRAGALAIGRSANLEAISHLNRGLECLKMLPESRERDRRELAMQNAVGAALIAVHGYAALEVGEAYRRARALCERLGETAPLVATLSGEFVYHFVRADYRMMRRLAEESRRLSGRSPDPAMRLASHRLFAMAAMYSGDFPEARAEFERILEQYDLGKHRPLPVHYVHDPQISALTYLALILWILGLPEQARRSSAAAFQCADELNQVNLTTHVRNFAGAGLAELLRDVPAVRAHAAVIVDLSQQHSLGYWLLNGLILRGWVLAQEGRGEEGVALMRRSATERAALGVGWYQIRYLCMLAETHLQLGQTAAGLRVVAEAKELMTRSDERMWQAELDRIEGELLRGGAPCPEAGASFERALAVARRQNAKSLELRAAASLARFWAEHGERRKAYDLLAPVCNWFTEGFDTPDLKDATALLDQLA